jgi:hypothetical protein
MSSAPLAHVGSPPNQEQGSRNPEAVRIRISGKP